MMYSVLSDMFVFPLALQSKSVLPLEVHRLPLIVADSPRFNNDMVVVFPPINDFSEPIPQLYGEVSASSIDTYA